MLKRSIISGLSLLVGLTINFAAEALQIKSASDNETVSIKISENNLTRIFVQGDRINSLTGSSDSYFHKENPETGDIYIQPKTDNKTAAFNVFIGTEQGRHYNLFVTPADISAEFVEIKPRETTNVTQSTWEKDTPYSRLLIRLLSAMAKAKPMANYEEIPITKPSSIRGFGNKVRIQLADTYLGRELRGEILIITNQTRRSLVLTETQFYQEGTRAISLKDHVLAPHSKTLLLRVMNNYVS